MVSDQQVKRLWRQAGQTLTLEIASAKAGMDPKTARKYLRDRRLPSEMRQKHTWRTRPDPFADVWEQIRQQLILEPGLQAKTLFQHLQEAHPGRFSDGQVRTLRRRISPDVSPVVSLSGSGRENCDKGHRSFKTSGDFVGVAGSHLSHRACLCPSGRQEGALV